MDWRAIVLIASLLLNGYLFNSFRKIEFQTRELTQSAGRQRQNMATLAANLEQMASKSTPSLRSLISERDLDSLIAKMATAEVASLSANCGPKMIRNGARLKSLQARFTRFTKEYGEAVQKTTEKNLADPKRVQQIAAQLKADVLRECKK